jgi:hypothetical protein
MVRPIADIAFIALPSNPRMPRARRAARYSRACWRRSKRGPLPPGFPHRIPTIAAKVPSGPLRIHKIKQDGKRQARHLDDTRRGQYLADRASGSGPTIAASVDRRLIAHDGHPRETAMTLTDLATVMFKFPPDCDAWRDFASDCLERLNVASLTAATSVDVPADLSDYWLLVVAGESDDYQADGARAMNR